MCVYNFLSSPLFAVGSPSRRGTTGASTIRQRPRCGLGADAATGGGGG